MCERLTCAQVREKLQEDLRRGWSPQGVVLSAGQATSLAEGGCLEEGRITVGDRQYPVREVEELSHLGTEWPFLTYDPEGNPIIY
ncbi:MAG: hypothetical protein JW991_00795 [Candidatus Pacebacteria bacterium]|nr:hypothetical protein [Candidatus Paceibacterota bacterium]